ncbi:hypothetical protein [Streptomyces sp. GC420]|uniref:hypothetical protein n=1 Tax=Streptomyces sp. GC420 TaxID=2697568 RepID=UPI001414D47E|nr:hypothetical protein [Streptomyces sp. GC420]NBM18819.1 hypothetical protein [Streptomyces sp. GC420]
MVEAYDAQIMAWQWFSRDHALAATLLCLKCGELEHGPAQPNAEETVRGLTWSEAQAAEHRTYAVAAILTAAAFLEAAFNELVESAQEDNLTVGGGRGGLQSAERTVLVELGNQWGYKGPPLVDRAQTVLQRLSREKFDESETPYKPAQTLARFRNRLIHYRPEWRTAGARPGDYWIAQELEPLDLALHPFTTPHNPFFPDRCLGHSLASWAWETSLAFAEEFFTRVGVEPAYADLRPQLTLNGDG